MREAASERLSGREKAVRSRSSDQGRRWEKPWRREEERRLMKERKAGVAMGGWDWGPPGGAELVDWGLEMGSVG